MQLIDLQLDHYNFYCPVSGAYIMLDSEELNENALSFRAYWLDEYWDEPTIKDPVLAAAWALYYQQLLADNFDIWFADADLYETLEKFFSSTPILNYAVFKIRKIEASLVPEHTVYLVIDMNAMA